MLIEVNEVSICIENSLKIPEFKIKLEKIFFKSIEKYLKDEWELIIEKFDLSEGIFNESQ